MQIWLFTAAFFAILLILILANYRLNNEFRIDTSWLALALAPVVIWLTASGQLTEFSGFGLAFKLKQAMQEPLSMVADGSPIEPEPISSGAKGSLDRIDEYIGRRVQAVTLTTNRPGAYANWAIEQYLDRLTPHSFFKYVLITNADGKFAAIVDPEMLLGALRRGDIDLVALLEQGDIRTLPGASAVSVPVLSNKAETLQAMDRHNLAHLPVVDEWGRFVGIIERDKVTSSIVAQLVASVGN